MSYCEVSFVITDTLTVFCLLNYTQLFTCGLQPDTNILIYYIYTMSADGQPDGPNRAKIARWLVGFNT